MPLVFDLRAVGDREAQSSHDVFQLFHRLGDGVKMADAKRRAGHRRVELRSLFLLGHHRRGRQSLGRGFESRLDLLLDLVETLADSGAIGLVDSAHALLCRFESALLRAQKLDARRLDRLCRSRRGERLHRLRCQIVQLFREIRQCHSRPNEAGPRPLPKPV